MHATRFIAAGDAHVGWERRNGRLVPLHDERAWDALCEFARDFKPHAWIEGGDGIDCGPISHWNEQNPAAQDLPIREEIDHYDRHYLTRMDSLCIGEEKHWLVGNHPKWIADFVERHPALRGSLDIVDMLRLRERGWKVYHSDGDQHVARLGKLYFTHGDRLAGGGGNIALRAVTQYERNIRLFHHHTFQAAAKVSAQDIRDRKVGMIVPALCQKNPAYARNRPNQWLTGFLYGFVFPDGTFCDVPVIMTEGRFVAEGRRYGRR